MAEKKDTTARGRKKLQDTLERLARTLEKSPSLKPGVIAFHLTGAFEGDIILECSEGQVHVMEFPAARGGGGGGGMPSFIEVMGDANTIRAILDGEIDARERFLSGGLRVWGDLRYLSDLTLELGVLKEPL